MIKRRQNNTWKNDMHLLKSSWIPPTVKSRNSSKKSKRRCWKCTVRFSRGRPLAGRGQENPKWWFLHSKFSKFYYSYHSKRWEHPLPYLTNSTKLHHGHMNIHLQTFRLVHPYPWFGWNWRCWIPTHQYLLRIQYSQLDGEQVFSSILVIGSGKEK